MTNAEKKLDELGFERSVEYYQKNNLDIISEIKYIKKSKEEVFEIMFHLFGELKKEVSFRLYDKDGISLPTVDETLGQIVLERKKELGWT